MQMNSRKAPAQKVPLLTCQIEMLSSILQYQAVVLLHPARVARHCASQVPVGVDESGNAGTTLQTLNLESGHYRTSADSENILECPREEACVGKDIAGEYCATGYQGACETVEAGIAAVQRTTHHALFMPHHVFVSAKSSGALEIQEHVGDGLHWR